MDLHEGTQEILAGPHRDRHGLVRWAARADARFRGGTLHLRVVLGPSAREDSRYFGFLP
jgi:hypothetical protein